MNSRTERRLGIAAAAALTVAALIAPASAGKSAKIASIGVSHSAVVQYAFADAGKGIGGIKE